MKFIIMKIIKINPYNPESEIVEEAVNVLKKGGILMYPTDTCYGLGANIANRMAFNKIYTLKRRSANKPVSVIVPSEKHIFDIAIVNDEQKPYIIKYFPGAVTLIFLTLDQEVFPFSSVGIRIPNYQVTQKIATGLNGAYVTTSANIANYPPAYAVNDFLNQLGNNDLKPDLILDAGKLPKADLSTVVDLTSGKPKIIRYGAVKVKEI